MRVLKDVGEGWLCHPLVSSVVLSSASQASVGTDLTPRQADPYPRPCTSE